MARPPTSSRPARGAAIIAGGFGSVLIASVFASEVLTRSGWSLGRVQMGLLAVGVLLCLGARWRPHVAAAVTLPLAAVAAALVLAELTLTVAWRKQLSPQLRAHPDYLFELVPDRQDVFERLPINGGQRILRRVNRDGYRGADLEPRGEQYRVVVYGDSFIEARFSSLDHTFAQRLEVELGTLTNRRVEVINAGVRAYGPDQVAVRMEREIPRLEPDLVIVAFFADNDLGELVRNKLFLLNEDGTVRRNAARLEPGIERQFEVAAHGLLVQRLFRKVGERLTADPDRFSRTMLDTLSGPQRIDRWMLRARLEYEALAGGQTLDVTNMFVDTYDADVSLTPDRDSARYKRAVLEGVMAHMRAVTGHLGVPLVALIIPSPIDVCAGYDLAQVDSTQFPAYHRSTLTDVFAAAAARLDIPFVNLFEPFREGDANALYFHGGNNHWNDEGQAMAARLMALYLAGRGLLDTPPPLVNGPARRPVVEAGPEDSR